MIILKRHALQKGCETQSFTSASVLRNNADAWPTSMYLIRTFTSKYGKFHFPYLPAVVFRDFIAKIRLFRRRSPDVVAPFFSEKNWYRPWKYGTKGRNTLKITEKRFPFRPITSNFAVENPIITLQTTTNHEEIYFFYPCSFGNDPLFLHERGRDVPAAWQLARHHWAEY